MTIKSAKRAMRREVITRVLALRREARTEQERWLLDRFGQLSGFRDARTVLLYAAAFTEEIDTRPFMKCAIEAGKRLVLPVVNLAAKRLDLVETVDPERDLVRAGHLGIPEPLATGRPVDLGEVDWILAPGIAFDSTGGRLGRGGGFYDRLLSAVRSDVWVWSLLFDEQWVEQVPMEPHDRRVSGLLSPSRRFERR